MHTYRIAYETVCVYGYAIREHNRCAHDTSWDQLIVVFIIANKCLCTTFEIIFSPLDLSLNFNEVCHRTFGEMTSGRMDVVKRRRILLPLTTPALLGAFTSYGWSVDVVVVVVINSKIVTYKARFVSVARSRALCTLLWVSWLLNADPCYLAHEIKMLLLSHLSSANATHADQIDPIILFVHKKN